MRVSTFALAGLLCGGLAYGQEIALTPVASVGQLATVIESARDGSGRLFIVEQTGKILILEGGNVLPVPFLDISGKTSGHDELGLLGLAFPPNYAQSQRFYVDYTNLEGNTVIAQYRVTGGNPDTADPGSETILLTISQPFPNHKGGQLRFGPDGYLYIGMGDGGSGGDPLNNGQSLNTLLAKILRIDVESNPGSVRIPPDNPFVNVGGARPEIWAYGLRNPWRFSFDRVTNDLWIGDVGQALYEEVDFQPVSSHGGENYGWNRMEGTHCYLPGCSSDGLTLPVWDYAHTEGCSIIGGFVYRGRSSPGLRGTYIYGDFCSGTIWGLEPVAGQWVNRLLLSTNASITTFGEDSDGELYMADAAGSIYSIRGSQAPEFFASGVVNSASYVPGLVPGSLATVFAHGVRDEVGVTQADRIPLPFSIGDVSVTIDGISAPVLAVANNNGQEIVNFQVPFEIAGRTSASVVVTRAGMASQGVGIQVLDVQAAIYSNDGTQAIVVRPSNYSLVTQGQPLRRDEVVFLYAAGLGSVQNTPSTGAGAPASPPASTVAVVSLSVAGITCDVPYAGLAPGLVGVYQVNFRCAQAPSGLQDLVIKVGGLSSPPMKVFVQ